MGRPGFPADCDRARASISLSLDEELPELRRLALHAHLRACPDCSAFAAEAGTFTDLLRSAPLARPSRRVLMPEPASPARRPAALRRPRRIALASAAAVAASALLGAVVGQTTQSPSQNGPASSPLGVAATQAPYVEQRLLAMLTRVHSRRGRTIAT